MPASSPFVFVFFCEVAVVKGAFLFRFRKKEAHALIEVQKSIAFLLF
jgi:hypothetical protein